MQPPATIVTYPPHGTTVRLKNGTLVVRGTMTDNTRTKRVVVNGAEATDIDYNFHQWEVKLSGLKHGPIKLAAYAEDVHGNVEQSPHQLVITGE